MAITRLSGGLTPANGADPRTFPAVWNGTADDLEAGEYSKVPQGGSAGEVLVKQSATDYDSAWVGTSGYATGSWIKHLATNATNLIPAAFDTFAGGIYSIRRPVSVDRLACEVAVGSPTAGCVLRLGLYYITENGDASLIVDGGTVDATTTGVKEITVSVTLPAGLVVAGMAIQGLPNNNDRPSVRVSSAFFNDRNLESLTFGSSAGFGFSSVSGALPTSPTMTRQSLAPIVLSRVA
jgi:hypothetical protein